MRNLAMLTAPLLLFGLGCAEPVAVNIPAPAPAAEVPKAAVHDVTLGCVIRGDATCQLGDAPKLTVTLTNQSDTDIYLVGSLDASSFKLRYPHCYFEVTGPDGKPATRSIGRMCGNMNGIREKDFVKVPASGTFDPYQSFDSYGFFSAHQLFAQNFQAVGKYGIRFEYSTKSADFGTWCGDLRQPVATNDKIMAMFNLVPKVEVKSNEFELTVVPAGK